MTKAPKSGFTAGLPSREKILEFIQTSDTPTGKREIARAFGLKGAEKIKLKALLRDMADEGLIDSERSRAFHKMGGVPKVTVLRVVDREDDQLFATPDKWDADGIPPPRLRVMERKGTSQLTVGDKILARTEERGAGYVAHPMKKIGGAAETEMGVLEQDKAGRFWLRAIDKAARRDTPVSDPGNAQSGQLVLATKSGSGGNARAKVTQVLGDPLAPKSFSLIAIHKHGIPYIMPDEAVAEARMVADLSLTTNRREDLRHLPILAIDPADARDHDDAIWAAPDDSDNNKGGFVALVAIADVSYYVRHGGALDKEALKRGNSVYFPDQVVPMLPHELSSDKCSLKQGQDRAALVCHMTIDAGGQVKAWRFTRALVRLAANIAYEDAQAAIDGVKPHPLTDTALRPLWNAWALLAKARDRRGPLNLDLPEKQVKLDDTGKISGVIVRERLDAHRLVEDFMIAANVAAAKALEAKRSPLLYRTHEPPSREKLVALKEYLKTLGIEFALGQTVVPDMFNTILERVTDETILPQVMEQILRTQTQALYTPDGAGHFGLALGSYAHFTSPIRRYSDLIVHRALVSAYGLEDSKPTIDVPEHSSLSKTEIDRLPRIAEAISLTERRAMAAERETTDRYIAAYLTQYVGQIVDTRITGVQNFGFFATVEGIGGDGIVPVSTLGDVYYRYDEAANALIGEHSGRRYDQGQRLKLKLVEANPISGGLRFAIVDEDGGDRHPAHDGKTYKGKPLPMGRRGRPKNIRHQGKRR